MYLDCVVKHFCCRMEDYVFERHNFWRLPTTQGFVIMYFEHMIGEMSTERKLASRRLTAQFVRVCEAHRQVCILQKIDRK